MNPIFKKKQTLIRLFKNVLTLFQMDNAMQHKFNPDSISGLVGNMPENGDHCFQSRTNVLFFFSTKK